MRIECSYDKLDRVVLIRQAGGPGPPSYGCDAASRLTTSSTRSASSAMVVNSGHPRAFGEHGGKMDKNRVRTSHKVVAFGLLLAAVLVGSLGFVIGGGLTIPWLPGALFVVLVVCAVILYFKPDFRKT